MSKLENKRPVANIRKMLLMKERSFLYDLSYIFKGGRIFCEVVNNETR